MALDATTGGNSFVTVAEADAYFADSLSADEWSSLSTKDAALIDATTYLCVLGLINGGLSIEIGGNVPDAIKKATYLLALYMATNPNAFSFGGNTTRLKAGPLEIEREIREFGTLSALPLSVYALIKPYLGGNSGGGFILELQ